MPGVDRECTTHHHACDCREAKFAELEAEIERLRDVLSQIQWGGRTDLVKQTENVLTLEQMQDIARAALEREGA